MGLEQGCGLSLSGILVPWLPPSCFSSQCPSGKLFVPPLPIAAALPLPATTGRRSQAYSPLAVRSQSWVKGQTGSEDGLMMLESV